MFSGRIIRRLVPVLFSGLALCSVPNSGNAQDASIRLNLVDRQLMLNQMMAKALCYVDLRVERKTYRNQLAVSQFAFKQTLAQLKDGNPALGILPENNDTLRTAIDAMGKDQLTISSAITGWSSARWGRKLFAAKVYEVNEELNTKLSDTIEVYRNVVVDEGGLSKGAAAALLLAGRQRMLAQKISKEFCLVASGIYADEYREKLKASIAQYTATTEKFLTGDKEIGLSAEPPGEIIDKIAEVKAVYAEAEPLLNKAADGGEPTKEDAAIIAEKGDALLRHWVQAVTIYQLFK